MVINWSNLIIFKVNHQTLYQKMNDKNDANSATSKVQMAEAHAKHKSCALQSHKIVVDVLPCVQ